MVLECCACGFPDQSSRPKLFLRKRFLSSINIRFSLMHHRMEKKFFRTNNPLSAHPQRKSNKKIIFRTNNSQEARVPIVHSVSLRINLRCNKRILKNDRRRQHSRGPRQAAGKILGISLPFIKLEL